jgi:hypothetical protein
MSRRDPDYLWIAIQTAATGLGALVAVGLCRLAIAVVEWWAR